MKYPLLLTVILTGCVPPHTADLYRAQDRDLAKVETQGASMMVDRKCNHREGPPSLQSRTLRSGAEVTQPCGLVVHEITADKYLDAFAEKVCHEAPGDFSDECRKRYGETFIARLQERYTHANWDAALHWCKAHPIECTDMRSVELRVLALHQQGVQAWVDASRRAVRSRTKGAVADRQERSSQATAAALRGLGAALKGPDRKETKVACRSSDYGTGTNTDCTVTETE